MTDILTFVTVETMSNTAKTSAILVGLTILLTGTAYPIFAQTQPMPKNKKSAELTVKQASKSAAFRAKLQTFKDAKKAQIAERVNVNLNSINQNQTIQMSKVIDKMAVILDKLEARVNQGKPDIKDPAAAKAAIASAKAAIATASAAVSVQAQKDYTIQVTSENKIRTDAKTQRDKLHTDLQALRKTVIEAKTAVANAIRIAKSGALPTINSQEGTSSGQQ